MTRLKIPISSSEILTQLNKDGHQEIRGLMSLIHRLFRLFVTEPYSDRVLRSLLLFSSCHNHHKCNQKGLRSCHEPGIDPSPSPPVI